MRGLDAGAVAPRCEGQVGDVAGAGRAVADFVGIALGVDDQILRAADLVLAGPVRVGGEDEGRVQQHGDGREVLGLVADLLVDLRVDGDAAGVGDQQRVTIGRGAGHLAHADGAVGAGLVVHDHWLTELLAELIRHGAGNGVGERACRKAHHDADGLGGPVVCLGVRGRGRRNQPGCGQAKRQGGAARGVAMSCGHFCLLAVFLGKIRL